MTWSSLIHNSPWFVSPHLSAWQKPLLEILRARAPQDSASVWLLSSGTQSVGTVKAINLSHEAILTSSAAVNRHLQSTARDRWLRPIPHYHIGGLSIYARAHLSGAAVSAFEQAWDPRAFLACLTQEKITLTSLVPTQIFDVVRAELRAPPSLRAVVVGGGALDPEMYRHARSYGWPILPSYGLTECCSQVATASLESLAQTEYPKLTILDHVKVALAESRILLSSPSLCRWIATARLDGTFTLENPSRQGLFRTEDLAQVEGREMTVLGRRDDVVKILGVLVSLQEVEHEVRAFLQPKAPFCILPLKDPREEHRLVLVTCEATSVRDWSVRLEEYNRQAIGPKRIRVSVWVNALPQGELGKIKKAELLKILNLS